MWRVLEHIAILAAVALATWAFCLLLDQAVEKEFPRASRAQIRFQDRAAATLWYSDIEHVSNSAHSPRRHRPAEVKP